MFEVRSFLLVGALASLICVGMLLPMRGGHARARSALGWALGGQLLFAAAMMLVAVDLLPHRGARWALLLLGLAGCLAVSESLRRLGEQPGRRLPSFIVLGVIGIAPRLVPGLIDDTIGLLACLALGQAAAVLLLIPVVARCVGAVRPSLSSASHMVGVPLALGLLVHPAVYTAWAHVLPRLAPHITLWPLAEPAYLLTTALMAVLPQFAALLLMGIVNGNVAIEYRKLAAIDTLTGLRGRRAFFEDGGRLLSRRFADSKMCCLLMLDLDHFKRINDTYGHPAGDKALVMFSNMLRVAAPEHAVAGRYGGEEFCMILPVEDRKAASRIADEFVRRTRSVVVETDAGTIPLTVSIGAAVSPADGVNLDDLVSAADRRVYVAKEAGRDRAIWADPPVTTTGKSATATRATKARARPRRPAEQPLDRV